MYDARLAETFSGIAEMIDSEASFTEKADEALALGADALGVEHAHLTRVVPELGHWEVIASTDPADGAFPVGETADLRTTFCRHTIDRNETVALHDAPNQGWVDDVAYETHALKCYVGTPLQLDDRPVGTLCFVGRGARAEPFDAASVAFVDWISSALASELQLRERDLALENYARLVSIFGRILRHNLRNDLTAIRGHIDYLLEELQRPHDPLELEATLDRIIALAEKSKELRRIAEEESVFVEQSVTTLVEDSRTDVESAYPSATVSTNVPPEAHILAFPTLKTAIHELIENAAKHGGESPTCTVTVESAAEAVTVAVADDGPGLPEHERLALRGESGTQLAHSTGVGLWIVWWIVDSHDGTIQTSVSESGTRVTLRIPRPSKNRQLIATSQDESL
ncbi:GAF domain-containing sensor histidine kinase [Halapricum hydrolyticum]|uniref:histidine kinase n=1 Tax=Halapricum hydrolyticum TaxID=2979991 RepID=A0AAE3IBK2_9EURY|nr:GAF domain-containing sensor histidine kinase [Halapricum hydrolyticum]MCU4718563.1 GAF domain-containing sensor histidine kinase [Halapricum hydrolyticum]MCU4727588.1 GAF domain-containing sensor histidine kinase [Halapricum hydrolyticum]